MALVAVTHKAVTGQARQFDGTLDAFLDILGARSKAGLSATCQFDQAGNFTVLSLSGAGTSVRLSVGDWIVFPSDATKPPAQFTNEQALAEWQA